MKMKNRLVVLFSLMVIVSTALASCAAPTPQVVVQTQVVEKSVEKTVQVVATPTPGAVEKKLRINLGSYPDIIDPQKSSFVNEIANIRHFKRQPYTGDSAFAHKAGLHASAIKVDPDMYQHTDPLAVGNDMRMLISDMAGRASIELKGRELGFDLAGQGEVLTRVTNRVKDAEANGYTYDAADASFELLLREELDGARPQFFRTESWRVIVETLPGNASEAGAEATVKMHVGGERALAMAEGNGPVNALDAALRKAVAPTYPEIDRFELIDF